MTLRLFCSYVICLLSIVFAHTTTAQTPEKIQPAPAFSADQLTKLPTDGWLTNGGDLFNRRYSPLKQLNRETVKDLKAEWRTHLDGSGLDTKYSGEADPLVYKGVIYVVTGADDVFALSVKTGKILWKYEANLDPDIDTICCGWTSRGLGMGDGKIYVGQLDGQLVALDQVTGEIAWSVQAELWQNGYTITSAPLYFDGLVITGFAGAEFATRGRLKAFNANTGKLAWTFYTVPGPGELGHETWPADSDAWKHGGGTVWQTPAVDPELGLLYFSTGNPGPDLNGAVREGDNLFTASIVAIDAHTGEYRWHFQQVHHDLWDYDSSNPVVLFDIEYQGETRKALAEVSKTAWVYILDRTTGEPLIGIPEVPVLQEPRQATSATQPIPIGEPIGPVDLRVPPEGFELVNNGKQFTPYWDERIVLNYLGANWAPSAYDPTTNLLYVCAVDRAFHFRVDDDAEAPVEGKSYFAGTFGPVSTPTIGLFAAMDMKTNTVKWNQHWGDQCYSGVTATAGGLLFVGRDDGRLTAMDAANGKTLWAFQTDAGVNATANTFEYEGQQYVVVLSAGNLFANSTRGDSVWLFSLNGTIASGEVTDSTMRIVGNRIYQTNEETANLVDEGAILYARTCQYCHGGSGEGGHNGFALIDSNLSTTSAMASVIINGRNQMPAFGQILDAEEIRALANFVLSLGQTE